MKYTSITATSNGFVLLNNPLQLPKAAGIYHSCTTTWKGTVGTNHDFVSKVITILSYLQRGLPWHPPLPICIQDAAGEVYSKLRSRKGEAVMLSRLCCWWQREVRPSDSTCSLSSWHGMVLCSSREKHLHPAIST